MGKTQLLVVQAGKTHVDVHQSRKVKAVCRGKAQNCPKGLAGVSSGNPWVLGVFVLVLGSTDRIPGCQPRALTGLIFKNTAPKWSCGGEQGHKATLKPFFFSLPSPCYQEKAIRVHV